MSLDAGQGALGFQARSPKEADLQNVIFFTRSDFWLKILHQKVRDFDITKSAILQRKWHNMITLSQNHYNVLKIH